MSDSGVGVGLCFPVAVAHPREGSIVCLGACVCGKLSVRHTWLAVVASTRLSVTKGRGWTDCLSNTLLSLDNTRLGAPKHSD